MQVGTCCKNIFVTQSDARRAANSIRKRFGGPSKVYWCRTCQGYHLTSRKDGVGQDSGRVRMAPWAR